MTAREIKKLASKRIFDAAGSVVSLMAFLFSFLTFFLLCEVLIYLGLKGVGYKQIYDPTRVFVDGQSRWFWLINCFVLFSLMSPVIALVRRLMLNIARGMLSSDTRRYVSAHAWEYYVKAYKCALVINFLKVFTMVPGMVGIYGVVHWLRVLRVDELTSMGLFFLTGSISLTCVWAILWIRYLISLSLAPVIMSLNPRSNVFDACDLSMRVMDGKHWRYLGFMAAFIKYVPAMMLVYPMFMLFPFYLVSRMLFQLELLGERGQDKLPGIIKRWKKYDPEEAGK